MQRHLCISCIRSDDAVTRLILLEVLLVLVEGSSTDGSQFTTSQDVYKRQGEETFSPRYTLHGFRYLEITGVDAPVAPDQIKAIVVSSMNEPLL